MYGNYYREDIYLGLKAVSLVKRSNIQRPFLRGSTIGGSTYLGLLKIQVLIQFL